jgi:thiaminase/transcriptional activator TenA
MFHHAKALNGYIAKNDKTNIDPPPQDSFFFKAFNANIGTASAALNTQFIQGIKTGLLDPNAYGALNTLDSYYCYNAATSYDIATMNTDPEKDCDLYQILVSLTASYKGYNEAFLDVWHILNQDCIVPTDTIKAYSMHERSVAEYQPSIYMLTAMLPCYYLWYWLSDKIFSGISPANVYSSWIEGNHSADTSYAIGNFIEQYRNCGKAFDEDKALEYYSKSMQYEYQVFYSAAPIPSLEVK